MGRAPLLLTHAAVGVACLAIGFGAGLTRADDDAAPSAPWARAVATGQARGVALALAGGGAGLGPHGGRGGPGVL
ncbi:hypothetical protein [Streptomyces sp. PT12]|uniref:hypothetical protein n=1 Tax=Streptomyces sp. PT12 TaxID=1510197 RepID=UPI0011BE9F81|nr:hypothetical protein [Streptomyces sp. PT12]